jgi:serine/threonine-protein kinase SRPK3
MLGPPPMDMLERGARSKEFFDGEGERLRSQSTV